MKHHLAITSLNSRQERTTHVRDGALHHSQIGLLFLEGVGFDVGLLLRHLLGVLVFLRLVLHVLDGLAVLDIAQNKIV